MKTESGPFGLISASNTRVFGSVERRADEVAALPAAQRDLRYSLDPLIAFALTNFQYVLARSIDDMRVGNVGAPLAVINNATNDIMELIDEVVEMRGRAAARTARAMFENLNNFADVTKSSDIATRYLDHKHVTNDLIGQRHLYFRPGRHGARPQATKRQRQLRRESSAPLRRVLKEYGSSFSRSFIEQNLRDRSAANGYSDGYDGYRILSGAIHGSSGASIGTRAEIDNAVVFRLGPNMELASIAYIEGMTWWCQLLDLLIARRTTQRLDRLVQISRFLRDAWPTIATKLEQLDRETWPKIAPPPILAVLALYPGKERWFAYRPEEETLTLAQAPANLNPKLLTEARELYRDYDPQKFGGRPLTILMLSVDVEEQPGATSIPAGSILVPEEPHMPPRAWSGSR